MKFIKSNWAGFEVDSSEFYASIETTNIVKTVKAFLESPYIEDNAYFSDYEGFILVLIGVRQRKKKSKNKGIMIGDQTLEEFVDQVEIKTKESIMNDPKKDSYLDKDVKVDELDILELSELLDWRFRYHLPRESVDLLEIAKISKVLFKRFPEMSYGLGEAYFSFYRKGAHQDEAACEYKISLTGGPIQYSQNWNDTDRWAAVLESIKRKAPLKWTDHGL